MHCLWCETEIVIEVTWSNFLFPDPIPYLCSKCQNGLERLTGSLCNKCGRRSEQEVCHDCERWQQKPEWEGILLSNRSVYAYNRQMQEMLARWKYRGDYVLRDAFADEWRRQFKQTFNKSLRKKAVLLPVPLSTERLRERGFNQAQALAELAGLPVEMALARHHGEKQSKKTRQERLSSENPFYLLRPVQIPVILVDDIYTTGITIRHAARLLKENGCPEVYAFTLAR